MKKPGAFSHRAYDMVWGSADNPFQAGLGLLDLLAGDRGGVAVAGGKIKLAETGRVFAFGHLQVLLQHFRPEE